MKNAEVAIRPDHTAWPMLIAGAMERVKDEHRRFRAQLGLPTDSTIVMSGHQAEFWHPGILAKYFAMNAAAEVTGTKAVWLTVDQDSGTPWRVRYPARELRDGTAHLVARSTIPTSVPAVDDVPTGCLPAFQLLDTDIASTEPFVSHGLASLLRAVKNNEKAPTAAAQTAAALDELIAPLTPLSQSFFATALAKTDAFEMLVEKMIADPRGCTLAYNKAVEQFPLASMRPLHADEEKQRFELPLWQIEPQKPRRHVYSDEIASIPRERLAPKALLMTGLVRWLGCELFIHGLGGGKYELVTDDWFARWLPEAHTSPAVVASATLTLPLGAGVPGEREIARAAWENHRAKHDPAMVGDERAAEEKGKFVHQISSRKLSGEDVASDYRAMHGALAAYRGSHVDELRRVETRATELASRRVEARIAADRTWAFPLYPRESLEALNANIHTTFAR